MRFACGLAGLALVLTSGCGQSETQIRDELRAQMMQRCNRDIAPNTSALPGFDSAAYCGCVTGKAMGERSVAELKTLFDDRARLTAEGRQAATECLAQQTGSGAAKAGPVSLDEADPAPAATPAKEKAREPAPRPRLDEVKESPQPRAAPATPRPPRPEPEPAPDDEEEEPSDRT